jgi:hypothetical protein
MRPVADGYGHDFPGHVDELVPGKAAVVQDGLIRFENSVGDPIVAHELPDVLHRIEFGALGWQRNECDVFRHDKLGGQMPARLIEQNRRMPPGRDLFCDFGKMQVHRLSVTGRQNERGALAVPWADSAKDVGRSRALIGWRRGPGAAPCPTPGDLVLLADARLVGEPDFYVTGIDAFLLRDGFQTGGKTFLKSSIAPSACA